MLPAANPESNRDDALKLFCDTLALAAVAQGTTAVVRLLGWIEARDGEEGGFLWLAGVLGYRPSKMAEMLRSTLDATNRRRLAISRKLKDVVPA